MNGHYAYHVTRLTVTPWYIFISLSQEPLSLVKENSYHNASGANSTFLASECPKLYDIPVIVDGYNQRKVGLDVANQYRTYFDTQLISRSKWYPLFEWILETALFNSHIFYRDHPANKGCSVEHFHSCLATVRDLLQAGSPLTMKSSFDIAASHSISRSAPTTQSALPPLPTMLGFKHTPLPLCPKVTGMHFPLWLESWVDCFLFRWRRSQGGSGDCMKTSVKCEDCNEALCFTPKQNCFYEFHHMKSIFIHSRGIWLDCGCVMCIVNAGLFVGPNPITGTGIYLLEYCCSWFHNFRSIEEHLNIISQCLTALRFTLSPSGSI